MKKFLAIVLAAACVFSLVACTETATETVAAAATEAATAATTAAETAAADLGTVDIDAINEIVANLDLTVPEVLGSVKQLADYKGVELTAAKPVVVTEEDALDYIEEYILPNFTEEVDVIENGDTANIDYEGKKDGVAFDGGTAQGYDLAIGSGNFIDGFEAGLVGKKKGETVDLNLKFPENYGNAELAGQAVVFTVKINSITRPRKLSDDIAAQVDESCKTAQDLINLTVSELQKQEDSSARQELFYNAVEKVLEGSDIEAAEAAVQYTLNSYVKNYAAQAEMYGLDLGTLLSYYGASYEEFVDSYSDFSLDTIQQRVILQEIAKLENLVVDDEARAAFAEGYGYSIDEMKEMVIDEKLFDELVLEDMANKFIVDNAKITYTEGE